MKFIENVCTVGRTGLLTDLPRPWNRDSFKTPMFLTYAKAGTIPHIMFNTLKYFESRNMLLLQHLPSVVEFKEVVETQGKGLSTFVGLPEYPFHLSVQDPASLTPTGYNVKSGVSVWSYGGKKLLPVEEFMSIVKAFQPISYQALCDSDAPENCSKKRLNKSVDNSLKFLDKCLEEHNKSNELKDTAIFGVIQGGYDSFLRKKSALETSSRCVDGFVIDGFHMNGPDVENIDFEKVKPILIETVNLLPVDKPRILNGAFRPEVVIEAVKCGIDIFDSSYAYKLTELGEACIFPLSLVEKYFDCEFADKIESKINLQDDNYKKDFTSILKSCKCYTCTHYSRAYVHHLLVTSELLAQILLMIHNLHHFSEFFISIRNAIENKN